MSHDDTIRALLEDALSKPITSKPVVTDYFGGCPVCGQADGCINIGRAHWYYCDEHRTKWCVGENMFSSWQREDEATWRQNHAKLASFADVKPLEQTDPDPTSTWDDDEPIPF